MLAIHFFDRGFVQEPLALRKITLSTSDLFPDHILIVTRDVDSALLPILTNSVVVPINPLRNFLKTLPNII